MAFRQIGYPLRQSFRQALLAPSSSAQTLENPCYTWVSLHGRRGLRRAFSEAWSLRTLVGAAQVCGREVSP
jgi:hypothetical protein